MVGVGRMGWLFSIGESKPGFYSFAAILRWSGSLCF
jgi:hypothetical protein